MRFRHTCQLVCFAGILAIASPALFGAVPASPVRVWETEITIPTYLAGDPEPNPMFYFGRQSQGAQAPLYPYPMFDMLTGKKADKTYRIVYLENEYLRIGVLPEIGGRIFEGVDKTNGYNFIYRQHVSGVRYAHRKEGGQDLPDRLPGERVPADRRSGRSC